MNIPKILSNAFKHEQECRHLINETSHILGVHPARFEKDFREWHGSTTAKFKDGLEFCKARALAGYPMPWEQVGE